MWRGWVRAFVLEEWRQCLKQEPYANFLINELFLFAILITSRDTKYWILATSSYPTIFILYIFCFYIYLNQLSYIQTNFMDCSWFHVFTLFWIYRRSMYKASVSDLQSVKNLLSYWSIKRIMSFNTALRILALLDKLSYWNNIGILSICLS